MSKAKTSVTAKKVDGDWQIKAVPQFKDALRQAGCRWDDKKICWIYTGEKLPNAVQQIVDGVYGIEGLLNAPESPNKPITVSEPPQPAIQTSAPPPALKNDGSSNWSASNSAYVLIPPGHAIPAMYETKSIPAAEKIVHIRLFTPDSSWTWYITEYDPKSDLAFGYAYDAGYPDGAEWGYIPIGEMRTARGHYGLPVERDLHFSPTPFGKIRELFPEPEHIEPDGTCPFMVENQRDLKPRQDWLGWMTCCECGLFLDLESNRKAGSKPLMGIGNGKVICPDCHRAKHNLPDIQLDAPKAKLPTKIDVEFKPGQFVEVMTNKVMGVVYNLSDQSDTVFIAVPDNGKKSGGYCGMGYSASVLKLSDYTLPERQVEFLQALAKGEAVAKNGATRKSLRNWGLISDDADWNQIILTRIGKAWLELNGMMPDSGLVLGDGTPLSEATVEKMSYVATTPPSNPTCPRCNSKAHLNRVEDIWQSGLVVGTNREYICSSCKHTFEQRQIFEKPKTNPKSAFASKSRVTPLRQQYLDLKAQYPDYILFYRLGDFYETFDDDAETAARELDLVLTGRPISRDERVPMAGVPHHAVDQYINRLVEKGYKVAVAEQMSEPNDRGIVERKVTRTLEPNLPEKGEVSECEPQVDETWIWHHVSDSGWGIDEKIRVRIVQIKKRIQVEVPTKKGEPVLRWVERKSLIERIESKPEKPTPTEMWWIDEGDNILRDDNPVFDHFAVLRGPFGSKAEAEFVLQNGKLPTFKSTEQEIAIKTSGQTRKVMALVYGPLAVHPTWQGYNFMDTYWTVTHIKSGRAILERYPNKEALCLLAEELSTLDFDQHVTDQTIEPQFIADLKVKVEQWKAAQQTAEAVLP